MLQREQQELQYGTIQSRRCRSMQRLGRVFNTYYLNEIIITQVQKDFLVVSLFETMLTTSLGRESSRLIKYSIGIRQIRFFPDFQHCSRQIASPDPPDGTMCNVTWRIYLSRSVSRPASVTTMHTSENVRLTISYKRLLARQDLMGSDQGGHPVASPIQA
jgi:hypothetical protein